MGSAVCKTCHPNIWLNFYKNPHYKSIASGTETPARTGCEGCHGPAKAHVEARGGKTTIPHAFSLMQPKEILDDCLACHADADAKRGNGTPVAVDTAAFTASKHGPLACVDCHADLEKLAEFPHPDTLKKVACASCHDAVGATYHDSIHARAREKAGLNVAPACADCHGKHDIRGKDDPKSRVAHAQCRRPAAPATTASRPSTTPAFMPRR